MNKPLRTFARRYLKTLGSYLPGRQEAVFQRAYDLGRLALGYGLGVLDVARVHQRALAACLRSTARPPDQLSAWRAAETFLLEALSPFEATHRGFGETNRRLQQVIATLQTRNLQLAESEMRLQAILDHSPAVIFLKDIQGRYVHVNRRFERLFRLRRERVVGRTDAALFSRAQAAIFRANDRKVLQAGVPLEFEETASYYDGVHVSIVSKFPLHDAAGKIYALCGIATDITTRKRAEADLRESRDHYQRLFNEAQLMQQQLRNLSSQILHVQEQERTRISRDLHDEVGQALTAISVNLAMLGRNGASAVPSSKRRLQDAQRLLSSTVETVHRFARELRPAMLDELGLVPALHSYLTGFARRTGLRVRFQGNPLAECLSDEQKIVLFRVAQESLANVAKHARARRVDVSLRKLKNNICMEIADNGKSFHEDHLHSAKAKQRLGLLGMQERVRLVNGQFRVKPQPGKGTAVSVSLPLRIPGDGSRRLRE